MQCTEIHLILSRLHSLLYLRIIHFSQKVRKSFGQMVIWPWKASWSSFHGKKSPETILVIQEVGGDSLSVPERCGICSIFEDPQQSGAEKAMAPHSCTLAWKIPWMEEPGRLQARGSLRVRHDWVTSLSLFTFMHWRRKWQPSVLAWRIPETEEPGGLPSIGSHRVGYNWSDLAAAAAGEFNEKISVAF